MAAVVAALIVSAAAASSTTSAARWIATGPEGGWITDVLLHPRSQRVAYAYSWTGLYRSTNGAATWQRRRSPRYLSHVALDPDDPRVAYAISSLGLHKTTNGGGSWSRLTLPTSGVFPRRVAVSPSSPGTVYALTSEDGRLQCWSSADAGITWIETGSLQNDGYDAGAFVVDPVAPTTMFVFVWNRGVMRSEDGGRTWASASSGLPVKNLSSSLAVDPERTGVLYAGTESGRVYRSVDSGRTWTTAASGLGGDVTTIAASAADGAVYAGTSPVSREDGVEAGGGLVYRSADGTKPWTAQKSGLAGSYVSALAPHPTVGGSVFVATDQAVLASSDGGRTWAERSDGLVATSVSGLAVDPESPQVSFAAVEQGIMASRDGGRSWRIALDVSRERTSVGSLLAVPGTETTLYAVRTDAAAPRVRSTLLRSRDGGRRWKTVGPVPRGVEKLVSDPRQPRTLYAFSRFFWQGMGLHKSTNGGLSWARTDAGLRKWGVTAFAVDPRDSDVLYAAAAVPWKPARSPLFTSRNGGRTWKHLTGFPAGRVADIAVDPHRRGTVYALTMGWITDVHVSSDDGRTWKKLRRSPEGGTTLLLDPVRRGVVYVGGGGGIYVKLGGSSEWHSVGPAAAEVWWLAVDARARRLYAGTRGRGVAATRLPLAVR